MNKVIWLIAAVLVVSCLASCVNTAPVIHQDIVPERGDRAGSTPVPLENVDGNVPTEAPTEAPSDAPAELFDAMGKLISGADHYKRYLTFRYILVYEEEGDTFLDGYIVNDYVKPITCAVDVVYDDDNGSEIARARLQTRDGKYLLVLLPGENVVYARILTDMTLTDREYKMEFDNEVGIKPLG